MANAGTIAARLKVLSRQVVPDTVIYAGIADALRSVFLEFWPLVPATSLSVTYEDYPVGDWRRGKGFKLRTAGNPSLPVKMRMTLWLTLVDKGTGRIGVYKPYSEIVIAERAGESKQQLPPLLVTLVSDERAEQENVMFDVVAWGKVSTEGTLLYWTMPTDYVDADTKHPLLDILPGLVTQLALVRVAQYLQDSKLYSWATQESARLYTEAQNMLSRVAGPTRVIPWSEAISVSDAMDIRFHDALSDVV